MKKILLIVVLMASVFFIYGCSSPRYYTHHNEGRDRYKYRDRYDRYDRFGRFGRYDRPRRYYRNPHYYPRNRNRVSVGIGIYSW